MNRKYVARETDEREFYLSSKYLNNLTMWQTYFVQSCKFTVAGQRREMTFNCLYSHR